MADIGTNFEIQNDKDIRYVGSTDNFTVLAFHEWLQGLADDPSAGEDFMDISRETPTDKSYATIITLINQFNIDDNAAQHLYAGSIIQSGGDVIYDGLQVLAPAGMRLEIIQNGVLISPNFWTTTLNPEPANGISHQFMVKVRTGGTDTDGRRLIGTTREWNKTFLEFKINGTSRGANVMAFTGWADDLNNISDIGDIIAMTDITNLTAGYKNLDVNNDTVDEYYYSQWTRIAHTINDFYERMKYLCRRGTADVLYGLDGDIFRGITHEVPVHDQGTADFSTFEPITWTGGTGQMLAVDDINAATKMWIQLRTGVAPTNTQVITGTTSAAYADVNGALIERTISTPFCGQSTGTTIIGAYGFGIKVLDLSASDKVVALDAATYQAPNYVTFTVGGLVNGEDYVLVAPLGYKFAYDGEVAGPFTLGETLTFGSPTGTAKLEDLVDLGDNGYMIIRMLTGSVPTNDSTIAGATASAVVNGVVSPTIDVRQFTLNGLLNGAAVTQVVVTEAIPTDTPATGQIRIHRASGKYTLHPYSAVNSGTKTFTITEHDFSGDNAANGAGVFSSYIDVLCNADTEAYTAIYSGTPRTLFIRVRDGGVTPIKTFETPGALGAAGGSTNAVRTSDA